VEALTYLNKRKRDIPNENISVCQFHLDSVVVVNQVNGLYKVKEAHLRELLLKVRILEQELGWKITYKQIPRTRNWEADALVNEALDDRR
jgi:ribonuclease HI